MEYALITGATSGIGRAYAFALASRNISLILSGRRAELLTGLKNTLVREYKIEVITIIGDLTDTNCLNAVIREASAQPLSWLINNAGFGTGVQFLEENRRAIDGMITVHAVVPASLCRALIPGMRERGTGRVINVSSIAAFAPLAGNTLYAATKSMLHTFTKALSLELKDSEIRVQSLLPGFTHTDFHDRLPDFPYERKNRGLVRWQTPEEVVRKSLRAIEGKKWKQVSCIPGLSNRILCRVVRAVPWRLYRSIAGKL